MIPRWYKDHRAPESPSKETSTQTNTEVASEEKSSENGLEELVEESLLEVLEGFAEDLSWDSGWVEQDPNGLDQHSPGAKLDAGKNRLGLVLGGFPRALWAVGEIGTYGANKYTDNGWMSVENGIHRYTDAMYRHNLKESMGEERDLDTDYLHAAHAAWNALARLELKLRELENGNNPGKQGKNSEKNE